MCVDGRCFSSGYDVAGRPLGPMATAEMSTIAPRAKNHHVRQRDGQLKTACSGASGDDRGGRNQKTSAEQDSATAQE